LPKNPLKLAIIDYVQTKKGRRVESRHWHHSIGLYSLFQKTPMFNPNKGTVKPGDAFENTEF
jgi:hypothetical protein